MIWVKWSNFHADKYSETPYKILSPGRPGEQDVTPIHKLPSNCSVIVTWEYGQMDGEIYFVRRSAETGTLLKIVFFSYTFSIVTWTSFILKRCHKLFKIIKIRGRIVSNLAFARQWFRSSRIWCHVTNTYWVINALEKHSALIYPDSFGNVTQLLS